MYYYIPLPRTKKGLIITLAVISIIFLGLAILLTSIGREPTGFFRKKAGLTSIRSLKTSLKLGCVFKGLSILHWVSMPKAMKPSWAYAHPTRVQAFII